MNKEEVVEYSVWLLEQFEVYPDDFKNGIFTGCAPFNTIEELYDKFSSHLRFYKLTRNTILDTNDYEAYKLFSEELRQVRSYQKPVHDEKTYLDKLNFYVWHLEYIYPEFEQKYLNEKQNK